jgi:DNA topoisomerase-6 subunit B
VLIELEARYVKGDKSVDEYLRQTALANPHVTVRYFAPGATGSVEYPRSVNELPREPRQIKPHPYGVELGNLIAVLQTTKGRRLKTALMTEFSRVSDRIATEICRRAGVAPESRPSRVARDEAERLYHAIPQVKIMAPPTDCIVPIGAPEIERALRVNVEAEFYTAVSRTPEVYRGNPFLIEAGLAYGVTGAPADELATVMRFANRVPLLYQPGACAITKAVVATDWKNYGIAQSRGALPQAPLYLFVHAVSVWVPFTSEAKEAVAHYPEIIKEIKLALQECGRRMMTHINKRQRADYEQKRRSIFELYIEELSTSLNGLTKCGKEDIRERLRSIARKMTKEGELQ